MIGVDLIGRIRRAFHDQGQGIKAIAREFSVSRTTVRKVVRGDETEFRYERGVQPAPKLGAFVEELTRILESEAALPRRERRSTQRLFEELRGRGYDGAHDSVHRFARTWRQERARLPAKAYVPMSFAPGEAYQFDWSHETITLQGLPLTVKAAHMRLSHSRMPIVRAYFRETQELVFDAHDKAFAFYGGICRRGIYDNMKTAVETVFVGKARQYNRRFLQMCSHHLIEPVACTPAAGWEKGQVENQVGNLRDQMFRPKPKVTSLEELNAWLEDQCIAYAKRTRHPESDHYSTRSNDDLLCGKNGPHHRGQPRHWTWVGAQFCSRRCKTARRTHRSLPKFRQDWTEEYRPSAISAGSACNFVERAIVPLLQQLNGGLRCSIVSGRGY